MKRNIILSMILLFSISLVSAQINRPEVIKKKTEPVKTAPTQTPPPSPALVYKLTAARVNIKTGSDNKEFPSKFKIEIVSYGNGILFWQNPENLRNELKINSTTDIGLEKWTNTNYALGNNLLSEIQKNNLLLRIQYMPNLITDAWKIEGISLTLEFKDQNENLHPALGSKTIVFNNANGFLNHWDFLFECKMDASLTPLTASIKNTFN